MIRVRDLLKEKGNQVWSVSPDTSLLEALQEMEYRDIGALVVRQDGEIKGIFSERDFARTAARSGSCILKASVENYMTHDVIVVDIDHPVEDCMRLMTTNHIRHLPVVENGSLAGMVTIGDLVATLLSNKDALIDSLQHYIEGTGYGK